MPVGVIAPSSLSNIHTQHLRESEYICHFWLAKTFPIKNELRQSIICVNLNQSYLVGKNMFCKKCARTVQYLR